MNLKGISIKRTVFFVLFSLMVGIIIFIIPFTRSLEDDQHRLVIRFDDYGIWGSDEWVQIEEDLLNIHDSLGVKITWSVIPNSIYPHFYHPNSLRVYPDSKNNESKLNNYPLSVGSKRVDVLKESVKKGVSSIATHGFYHPKYYNNIKNSEFYGVDYDTQFYKIINGKGIIDSLFNVNVHIFAPPHNSFDQITLDALSEAGYTVLTSRSPSLRCPNSTVSDLNRLDFTTVHFEALVKKYKRLSNYSNNPVDVLLIHHTDFTDNCGRYDSNKIKEYQGLLELLKEKDVQVYSFDDIVSNIELLKRNSPERLFIYRWFSIISPQYASRVLSLSKPLRYGIIFCLYFFILIGVLVGLVVSCFNKITKRLVSIVVFTILAVYFIFVPLIGLPNEFLLINTSRIGALGFLIGYPLGFFLLSRFVKKV